jgi:hypothetical protein
MKNNLRRIGMIELSLFFWAVMATSGSAFGQVQSQPFTLTISSDQPAVAAGSDVFIRITQRNTSSSVVDCSSWEVDSTDLSFNYDVRNEAGKKLKQREGMANGPGSQKSCSLQPGGALSHNIWISWLYNLRSPGKYSVRVSRYIDNSATKEFNSNVIVITVLPPQ